MKINYNSWVCMARSFLAVVFLLVSSYTDAQVVLENEIKITDFGLHFDGADVGTSAPNTGDSAPYDFYFGRNISAHGDCIKTYGDYVFMTWYLGGKAERNVMLTRYNLKTGTSATIQFPHRHTGYQNKYWIGESHNTIAVGVSPLDGSIHLLYDMHSYSSTRPSDGSLSNDYFRYSYSIANAASLADADFTLDKFVNSPSGDYKHLRMPGSAPQSAFVALTYPKFFLNDAGDLFMYMREGGNDNGAYKFCKYNATNSTWSNFTNFNILNAKAQGEPYNWGLYGDIKYVNGKMRIGFQRRSSNATDKFIYQNGVYYAYSDDQNGFTGWKNHQGQGFNLPLINADFIKVMEPGDYVQGTNVDAISIVGGFDWTVTDNGDVHIISSVRDNQFNVAKNLHTYKPAGATDFITTTAFSGGEELYASGTNIYIIGLNSAGRVFVQKAEGGTSNFTKVYEATSGRVFDHGQVYISNGKLFYYLMEKKTGNAQPLYLQIIDLDIVPDPFRVSLTSPSDGANYNIGETVQIAANAVDENGSISKVEFKVNGAVFGEDTTAPYSLDWTPTVAGNYSLQAVAYNATNATVSSTAINVNFKIFDPTDLSGNIYRVKNFVTGKYMHSVGSDVVQSDTDANVVAGDKEWEFVKSGVSNYVNIDSRRSGILRAAGSPVGDVINTGFSAPNTDTDKQWEVIYNNDGTYSFKVGNGTRYLYHSTNGIIEHIANSDDRSKWILESTTLSNKDFSTKKASITIYPNPVRDYFTVALDGVTNATIRIYDVLGKQLYENKLEDGKITIENKGRFKSGFYLINILSDKQEYFSKFVVK